MQQTIPLASKLALGLAPDPQRIIWIQNEAQHLIRINFKTDLIFFKFMLNQNQFFRED